MRRTAFVSFLVEYDDEQPLAGKVDYVQVDSPDNVGTSDAWVDIYRSRVIGEITVVQHTLPIHSVSQQAMGKVLAKWATRGPFFAPLAVAFAEGSSEDRQRLTNLYWNDVVAALPLEGWQ